MTVFFSTNIIRDIRDKYELWVHSPDVHVFLNYISIVCLGDEEVKTCSVLFLLSLYVSMYLAFSVSLQLHVQSCMVWIWVMRKSRQVEQR